MQEKNRKSSTLGDKIREIRQAFSLSQKDFASKINVSQSFLSEVERGLKNPGVSLVLSLKRSFPDINLDYLAGEGEMCIEKRSPEPVLESEEDYLKDFEKRLESLEKVLKTESAQEEPVKIPLYQYAVSASSACIVSEEVEEYLPVPKTITRHPRETFAVRASGDFMIDAGIEEGDIVICDAKTPVKTGCIVIASIDGAQTFKKIILDQGTVTLAPANHSRDLITVTADSNLTILGVVIALFRTL